jgi:hypothetical protein
MRDEIQPARVTRYSRDSYLEQYRNVLEGLASVNVTIRPYVIT